MNWSDSYHLETQTKDAHWLLTVFDSRIKSAATPSREYRSLMGCVVPIEQLHSIAFQELG